IAFYNYGFARAQQVGMFVAELFFDCVKVLVSLRVAYSGPKPPENAIYVGLVFRIRLSPERRPEVSRRNESESRRSHPDHGPQLTAKSYAAADSSAISRKACLPKRIAEHNGVRPTGAIFILRKTAAEYRLHPESTEEIRADTERTKALRVPRTPEIDARRTRGVPSH